ncbi:MAG: prepilin-type N-terminal cleavage/methylation domain-containing protein [Armatimonadota bacterium]|nr:prepilin-type N-terminal cleavage/methylation domain-containing protein [Armatimonadota bacterium]
MKRRGFTLIELLVVIAIIAILAAIIFPVFNAAKRSAKMRADSSNMASLHQALKLYREDQGGFPPLLLQVAEYNGTVLRRVDELRRAYLYRGRVKDIDTFKSVEAIEQGDAVVQAYWPNIDPRANGVPCNARQILGNELGACGGGATLGSGTFQTQAVAGPDFVRYAQLGIDPFFLNGDAPSDIAQMYAWDTFDVARVRDPANPTNSIYELRYALFWTLWGQQGGNSGDSTRQLGYHDPREDTIITWDSYFARFERGNATPIRGRDTMVLYLSGTVRNEDARDVWEQSWGFGRP